MDNIIHTLKREIALDGEQGTSLDRIWHYVKVAHQETLKRNSIDSDAISIESDFKEYLWPYILRTDGLLFVANGKTLYDTSASSVTKATSLGSANRFANLPISEVEAKHPDMIVKGSTAVINRELYGREDGNKKIQSSDKAQGIYELVARSRSNGATQSALAKNLSIDSRSMYHFIKVIASQGLIVKFMTHDGESNTNLILLRRFSDFVDTENRNFRSLDDNSQPNGAEEQAGDTGGNITNAANEAGLRQAAISKIIRAGLRQKISDVMKNLQATYIVELDLVEEVGIDFWNKFQRKYFHRVARDMCQEGYIEC
ncbi:hypothetical protein BX070DRAFT_244274, partial [Coemansia spiralis]